MANPLLKGIIDTVDIASVYSDSIQPFLFEIS